MPRAAVKKAAPATLLAPANDSDDLFLGLDETDDHYKIVMWGKEGSTKTTCAALMTVIEKPGKVLILNVEGGLKKRALVPHGVDTSRIALYPKPGSRPTRAGVQDAIDRVHSDLMEDPNSWAGIVMDSGTEVTQFILGGVQRKRVRNLKNQGREHDPDHVDIADYGTTTKIVRDFLRSLRDVPCHVVITCLERRDKDKESGKITYGPALPPALGTDILGYVDIVLAMKSPDEDGPARALTKESSRFRCKDRFNVLPRVLIEPTFPRILDYVEGRLTEDTDPLQEMSPALKKSMDKTIQIGLDDDDEDDADGDD